MKHVFVETNFIVDVLKPFPNREAESLLARVGTDVTLYLPWCAVNEAKRTLDRVIREDLAFLDNAGRFMRRIMGGIAPPPKPFHENVDEFIKRGRTERYQALFDFQQRIDALSVQASIIDPSPAVVARTIALFPTKSLPPFDEMVLGAVIERASQLHVAGVAPLYFCNRNKADFAPTTGNGLENAYTAAGLEYREDFRID